MSLLRGLFGRKHKKRLDRAGMLVQAARINAVGMFVPLLDRFAVLRDTDVEHWDYIVTVASVFTAATRLNNLHLRRSSTDELMQVVTEGLQKWNPDGSRGFEDCKTFFESEFDRLTEAGHEPRFVASDAIGAWIT